MRSAVDGRSIEDITLCLRARVQVTTITFPRAGRVMELATEKIREVIEHQAKQVRLVLPRQVDRMDAKHFGLAVRQYAHQCSVDEVCVRQVIRKQCNARA